ncbi:unnamed protein product [Prunus armeniaca]|uniref:Uncharacterized protein n=1 Tax=Prunus armeniaca TaxID=36596 RepID=A0A6J5XS97_PRUAR|nr:unnamed protein product [Prunus armeniaca]
MEDSGVSVSVTVFPPAMGSSPPVPHLVAFVSVACPKVLRSSPVLCQKPLGMTLIEREFPLAVGPVPVSIFQSK